MSQELFEKKHDEVWTRFDRVIGELEKRAGLLDADELQLFPRDYRMLCKHLALAKDRRYSAQIVDRLNRLVIRAHRILYRDSRIETSRVARFFTHTFPRAVRKEWRLTLLCLLLFYGPVFGMMAAIYAKPDLIYSVLPPETVRGFEQMYDPAKRPERSMVTDFLMFGHYIQNNVGIGFRTFGSGLLFGIGSIFLVLFNGVTIGALMGHMLHQPFHDSFFTFVVGHGSFELTAIVLAGVAGVRLGLALVFPGNLTRKQALVKAGETGLVIVWGMAAMLTIAAFVEAFWSPREFAPVIKYTVGGFGWLLVITYFLFMGRGNENR